MNVGGELEVTVFVFARLHRLKQMLGRKKEQMSVKVQADWINKKKTETKLSECEEISVKFFA